MKNIISYHEFLNESESAIHPAVIQAIDQQKEGVKSIYNTIKRNPAYAAQNLQMSDTIIKGAKSLYMTLAKAPGGIKKPTLDRLLRIAKLDWRQARLGLINDTYEKLLHDLEEEYKGGSVKAEVISLAAKEPEDKGPQTPAGKEPLNPMM